MRLLHWVLAREEYLLGRVFPEAEWGPRPERVRGAGDGWVSALWSDIGPRFYEECGTVINRSMGRDHSMGRLASLGQILIFSPRTFCEINA